MFSLEILLLIVSILIILCILIFKFFDYLGIPVLLLFLGIGILAGAEGIGRINFDDARLAQSIGIVALVFILFAGGLDTNWNQVKPIFKHAIILSTFGVFATAILVGFFASFVLKIPILYCILLGSIVSSTDAPAVFSILRSKNVKLKGTLKPLLELESGSNDPMAIFLTIASIQLINSSANNPLQIMTFFILQMGLGAVIGLTFGKLVVLILLYRNLENSYTMVMKFFIIVKKTTRYSGEDEMKMVSAQRDGLLYSGGFQGVSP